MTESAYQQNLPISYNKSLDVNINVLSLPKAMLTCNKTTATGNSSHT